MIYIYGSGINDPAPVFPSAISSRRYDISLLKIYLLQKLTAYDIIKRM